MYILDGLIQIGNDTKGFLAFNAIHEVEIIKGVEELSDTAIIKLPTNFKIRQTNEQKFTEEAINVGDKVTIMLAYQGQYSGVEFKGYVKKISPKIPLEIHCEDSMWLLRRKNINKSLEKTTLKEILQEVVKDTAIQLDIDRIPNINLDKWIIKNANGTQVLESIKKQLCMTIFLNDEGKLYCGLQQGTNIGQSVVYDLNYNLVENNLEFKAKDDRRIKVKYKYKAKDNKETSIEVGDIDGEQREFYTSVISDEKKLTEMATAEIEKLKYDGFDGDVTSFLIPFATRGMKAIIKDKDHKNREANYFIKKVVTTFGTGGARRKVTISNKL
ncbi:late control protein [Flavobacterium sp.]|uniref:late control protein n=1 Tax=Flavobacterium sp. TaxID=239 RepID=UPI003753C67A